MASIDLKAFHPRSNAFLDIGAKLFMNWSLFGQNGAKNAMKSSRPGHITVLSATRVSL
jgi:hypothetical protein